MAVLPRTENCFPWSNTGPLCPALREPALWQKVFTTLVTRKPEVEPLPAEAFKALDRKPHNNSIGTRLRDLFDDRISRELIVELVQQRAGMSLYEEVGQILMNTFYWSLLWPPPAKMFYDGYKQVRPDRFREWLASLHKHRRDLQGGVNRNGNSPQARL